MSISLKEKLLTLTEVPDRLPGRVHQSTIWRWISVGIRGVRLETIVVGGRRYSSVEALERFSAATAASLNPEPDEEIGKSAGMKVSARQSASKRCAAGA